MKNGHIIRFQNLSEGLDAIEQFLANAENRGRTTIESFRGWYCYSASEPNHICKNWEEVVIKTKNEVESL